MRPRWRCFVCPESGHADTVDEAFDEWARHYRDKHLKRALSSGNTGDLRRVAPADSYMGTGE